MNKIEIENEILKYFYNCWETGYKCTLHSIFTKLNDIDEKIIQRVSDELEDANFMVGLKNNTHGDITARGIIEAEKREIISAEKIQRNDEVRYKILETAFNFYNLHDNDEPVSDFDIMSECSFSESEVSHNLDLLEEIGYVIFDSTNSFYISKLGIKQFQISQKRKYFKDEFERISKLAPQPRGIALEKLIAKVVDFTGWQQEANITTSYEQIDVVIHLNREFYLIECKWEKNPIEADVIDKLFGKLSRRAGTHGILMSMSGFTKGCEDCVRDSTGQKLFLLFGKGDIEQIISNPNSFKELFNNKYKELVMRRNVDWS